ncbi:MULTISPECIES: acetyl-CoA carboxylase biotin carboxyl carrier protein [Paenibacillus]|uniref:Biotin carboxyl carrier protein of acetyl-CoA carboxylase n=1 Tax=Paenibacillus alginolyticus TaxID=59839 RepID=A0ABT4GKH3_9BACL|nr:MULTISPECIES: acetyl-CoA carboxylase biotin carboxyl carrier protein [Paenibacillus]KRF12083.1 acetyl-CoA carboxylase biotin carboxyl carrier protein subunit [Paenibacillus sp. Soil787]MCY9696543.1 acetyl-CoA carboxylase biotin carboxyl carrier protein [Paenibacillus alginolyticus]MEC0148632.1 acetyl-CoA carboxylase biotin carboxyl carrier protein [Paenibacillus alginolyticus]
MFKLSEIKELIKLVDQSSLQELEIENEGARLSIRKPNKTEPVYVTAPVQHTYAPIGQASIANTAPAAALEASIPTTNGHAKQEDSSLHKIVSPMVGTFYQSASPGSAPFVSVGSKVGDKNVVCIVEAMKLMNEIEAEIKGEIVEVLVDNGQLVEYGQPLFLVRPE